MKHSKLEYKIVCCGGAYFVYLRRHWWQRWRKEISVVTRTPLVLFGKEELKYFIDKLDPAFVKSVIIE